LDTRLKKSATEGRDLTRLRQLLIFERFLARIVEEFDDAVVVKGGMVLELRLRRARMTKDVDIRFSGDTDQLLSRLQRAGRSSLQKLDFMRFEVVVDPEHPNIGDEDAKYEGQRFRVDCKIAERPYGNPFGLDVAVGDPMIREPEEIGVPDRLEFVGVPPPRLRIYPVETHLAEKLHAYTKPRDRPNSRLKDLPDMALISHAGPLKAEDVHRAFVQTFEFRATHEVPTTLPTPPATWHQQYEQRARDFDLEWKTLAACFERACRFINPVLAGDRTSTWDPEAGEWRHEHDPVTSGEGGSSVDEG
jgi:hypothetical protein